MAETEEMDVLEHGTPDELRAEILQLRSDFARLSGLRQAVEREAAVPGGATDEMVSAAFKWADDWALGEYGPEATCPPETKEPALAFLRGVINAALAAVPPAHRPPQPGVVTEELRVPEGWKLVPVEPTSEMKRALALAVGGSWDIGHYAWEQGIAAAPSPGASVTASPADGDVIEALREIDGCFEAAYIEGLADKLADAAGNSTAEALADLINRRLLPARTPAIAALSRLEASQPDNTYRPLGIANG